VNEHLDTLLDRQRAAEAEERKVVTDPDIIEALKRIGLHEPDYADGLHRRLVDALVATRGMSWGNQLVRMKFEVNWAQETAGREYAQAQTDWLHQIDVRTVPLVAPADGSKPLTRAFAEQMVRAQDDMYVMQLAALVAEKREQSLRKLLDTMQSAINYEQTNRADVRASDLHHARTGT
jgi:hypothetical protein